MDDLADIEQAVHTLKMERDTWKAVALQYKAAFETQTNRLQEFQDLCVTAQAELENERALANQFHRQLVYKSSSNQRAHSHVSVPDPQISCDFATRTPQRGIANDSSTLIMPACNNPLFQNVHEYYEKQDLRTAMAEVERLLRGPLSSKARAEGLLLKSGLLHAFGPDELSQALAVCSEAMDLCRCLAESESILAQLQSQRRILSTELQELVQSRDSTEAHQAGKSKELQREPLRLHEDNLRVSKRRSGFDERRTLSEELMAALIQEPDSGRRRTSMQLRYAAARAKHMSLPHRWNISNNEYK